MSNCFFSLSNGEDFITTEQLQRRVRSLSSPSTSNLDYPQSNNSNSSNSSQKKLNNDDNDCFSQNGLPDDSPSIKDEDRTNDAHGRKNFLRILNFVVFFFMYSHAFCRLQIGIIKVIKSQKLLWSLQLRVTHAGCFQ